MPKDKMKSFAKLRNKPSEVTGRRPQAAGHGGSKENGQSAIILAGGSGTRMSADKQYIKLCSKPMIEWTLDAFSGLFDEIILVLSSENIALYGKETERKGIKVAAAGETRIKSLISGFSKVSPKADIIAVHDGARPLVDRDLILRCVSEAKKNGVSVPAVALKDTIKRISPNGLNAVKTLNRANYAAVQTPQCYRRDILEKIIKKADLKKDYSDESQILEEMDIEVRIVKSDYFNIKVTTPEDIIIAEAFMKNAKKSAIKYPKPRFGFGYDIHRMVEGRPLIIAGERIKHKKGLIGHSDGDVVIHAVCDALLGSIAAGEIGVYFPPTDLTIMGVSSRAIAEKVLNILAARRAKIIQIDVTIVAEEPQIKPYYAILRKNISEIFKLDISDVSIKAKSREGLGEVGHGEAITCYAVASVEA
ncbi:MAG: 2-C-methyl-D-erythritol 4-phosphate cytidylyltransferase [Elusimicrobia bacterium]|nr:2-C-methyl-D-erythritol 4-phosphate cytidylyltransferase [Elusimicrobiota bacterium]